MQQVTVVVTVCDEKPWLIRRALNSLILQTVAKDLIEILVIDDASTETSTLQELAWWSEQTNIKVLTNRSRVGLHRSRMAGVSAASTDYVLFLDADDCLTRDAVWHLLRASENGLADLVSSDFMSHESGQISRISRRLDSSARKRVVQAIRMEKSGSITGHLWRRELLEVVRELPLRGLHVDDLAVIPYLLVETVHYRHVDKALYFYDKSESTRSLGATASHFRGFETVANEWQKFASKFPEIPIVSQDIAHGVITLVRFKALRFPVDADASRMATKLIESWAAYAEEPKRVDEVLALIRAGGNHKWEKNISWSSLSKFLMNRFVILCQANYHVPQAVLIANEANRLGLKPVLVDQTHYFADGRRASTREDFHGLRGARVIKWAGDLPLDALILARHVIAFNDYNPTNRDAWEARNCLGLGTAALVEGICDFSRRDSSNSSPPYRASDTIFVAGDFDLQFFQNRHVVSVGSLLLANTPARAETSVSRKTVAVNVNFTYGVMEEHEPRWVRDVVSAAKAAGAKVIFTQHPMSKLDLSVYPYEIVDQSEALASADVVVSRFGSIMLFAIAMGIPLIYHNPHGEKAEKFQEPSRAFIKSTTFEELTDGLIRLISEKDDAAVREKSRADWLRAHVESVNGPMVARKIVLSLLSTSDDVQGDRLRHLESAVLSGESQTEGWLVGPFARRERFVVDESQVALNLSPLDNPGTLVDVGAHHGNALNRFLREGWKVLAFEPDPWNREALLSNYDSPLLTVRSEAVGETVQRNVQFYQSPESTEISSLLPFRESHKDSINVDVTSLSAAFEEQGIESCDVLKIDTEGWDLFVLRGFPWEKFHPKLIVVEFEDSKTASVGYSADELCHYLQQRGYEVFVYEWHPILRYGLAHEFRGVYRYSAGKIPKSSWGNLLAVLPGVASVSEVKAATLQSLVVTELFDDTPAQPQRPSVADQSVFGRLKTLLRVKYPSVYRLGRGFKRRVTGFRHKRKLN